MRITGIHARNFLSFDTLDWNGLDRPMTLVVGPNGSGKTNLVRVIEAIIGAVSVERASVTSLGPPHRVGNGHQQCHAWFEVEWSAAPEQALIRDYFAAALSNPAHLTQFGIPGVGAVQSERDRVLDYAEALDAVVTTDSVRNLFNGSLGAVWLPGQEHPFAVYYRFAVGGDEGVLLLNQAMDGALVRRLPSLPVGGMGGWHLANRYIDVLPKATQTRVVGFLTGRARTLPRLTFDLNSIFLSRNDARAVLIQFGTPADNGHTTVGDRVAARFGMLGESSRSIPPTLLFETLLERGVVLTANVRAEPRRGYTPEHLFKGPIDLKNGQDVALHLFRLRNGDAEARVRFDHIRTVFRGLSRGKELDARLPFPLPEDVNRRLGGSQAVPQQVPVEAYVRSGDVELPLVQSGAGTIEMAFLSCLTALPADRIIILDEPGANLHPDAQRRLVGVLQGASGQVVVITHSPYLIDPRRAGAIYRARLERGATRLCSPPPDVWDPGRRGNPDFSLRSPATLALLFASVVVLVDGAVDEEAFSVWFGRTPEFGGSLDDLNIRIHPIGSKTALTKYVRWLKGFAIPWVAMCDGDALGVNGNALRALRRAKCTVAAPTGDFATDRSALRTVDCFVFGESEKESLDSFVAAHSKRAPRAVRKNAVAKARWVAEREPCPTVVRELFDAAVQKLDEG